MSESVLPMLSSRSFIVSGLTFRYLIHFEFIFVYGMRESLTSLIYIHLSSFCNTTYWRDYLFSIVYSCLFWWRLIDHRCMGLFLGCLFCSIDLCICFCANPMPFWLLWLCSMIWSLGGLFLKHCSFSSGLLWQFWVFLLWFYVYFRIICSNSV